LDNPEQEYKHCVLVVILQGGVCIPVPKRNRTRLFGSITPHVEHAIPNVAYSSLHNNAVIPDAVYKELVVAGGTVTN